ncbi:MAG: phosphoribosylanthranilate isomerase [bacterium]
MNGLRENIPYQRTRVKICGLTSLSDAMEAVHLGADALGFIFTRESPRCLEPEAASAITAQIPPLVTRIGVFKDQDPEWIRDVVLFCNLHIVQLHGSEPPEYCESLDIDYIKAFRMQDERSLGTMQDYTISSRERAFLLDTFVHDRAGGTGKTFDWNLVQSAAAFGPIILSGGLHPGNVGQAILQVRPFAVDTCSGVEREPGKKDAERLQAFFDQVHQADMVIGRRGLGRT